MKSLKKILEDHAIWLLDSTKGIRADLTGADLTRANLRGANLTGSNLTGSNLRGSNLTGANLMIANLTGANLRGSNLTGANLTDANLTDANLRGANLRGADLSYADLRGADLRGADFPSSLSFVSDSELLKKVSIEALSSESSLEMDTWHTCETTHCIAGWAIHLHPDGKRLVENSSEYLAGRLLLGDEAASHFFDNNEDAKRYLSQFLPKIEPEGTQRSW